MSLNQLAHDLTEVYRLLRKGWIQRSYATDASGHRVHYAHHTACCFCLTGALNRVAEDSVKAGPPMVAALLAQLVKADSEAEPDALVGFNDSHTQEQVLDLVSRAIEAAS